MFRAIISPSSEALDYVYILWYNAPTMLPAGDLSAAGSTTIIVASGWLFIL